MALGVSENTAFRVDRERRQTTSKGAYIVVRQYEEQNRYTQILIFR